MRFSCTHLAPLVALLLACGASSQEPSDAGDDAALKDSGSETGLRDSGMDTRLDGGVDGGTGLDAGSDGGATDAGPARPTALCGGIDYAWLPKDAVGAPLERRTVTSHTQLDLALMLLSKKLLTQLPKHNVKVELLRYTTQDRGVVTEATGAVAYPTNRTGDTPVMLLLHGTTGFADDCAPSRQVAGLTNPLDAFSSDLPTLLSILSSLGYIVVAPDYIGLKGFGTPSTVPVHPYLVGEPTAIASLDMVRAAKAMLAGQSAVPGKLVVVGGSQGGHAAAFVDRLGPHYAPELPITAGVWDVPPTDLMAHAKRGLNGTGPSTDNIAYFMFGANYWYNRLTSGPDSVFLPPYNTSIGAALASDCGLSSLRGVASTQLFTPGVIAAKDTNFAGYAPSECFVRENTLQLTSIPKVATAPTLFLTAENDSLVLTSIERAAFTELCSQGYSLEYLECAGATHTKPLSYAIDTWLTFLSDRLANKAMPASVCSLKAAERCSNTP